MTQDYQGDAAQALQAWQAAGNDPSAQKAAGDSLAAALSAAYGLGGDGSEAAAAQQDVGTPAQNVVVDPNVQPQQ